MVSLFLLLGCNLSYIVDLFTALHELASASARTLLKLASSVRARLKPYWATLIANFSPKKISIASTGFQPMASALALRCTINWAMETHMLGADQFIEFIFTMEMWSYRSCNWSAPNIWVFIAQLKKHRSANAGAMITSPFHLYSRSSINFISNKI